MSIKTLLSTCKLQTPFNSNESFESSLIDYFYIRKNLFYWSKNDDIGKVGNSNDSNHSILK